MPSRNELIEQFGEQLWSLGKSIETASEKSDSVIQVGFDELTYEVKNNGKMTIAAAVINYRAMINSQLYGQLFNLVETIKKKNDMISSIQLLQKRHSYLTYPFVINRSFAHNTDREERRTILNGLINDGIVIEYDNGGRSRVEIPEINPALDDWLAYLESIANAAKELT